MYTEKISQAESDRLAASSYRHTLTQLDQLHQDQQKTVPGSKEWQAIEVKKQEIASWASLAKPDTDQMMSELENYLEGGEQ